MSARKCTFGSPEQTTLTRHRTRAHMPSASRSGLRSPPICCERITFEGEVSESALDELFARCDIFCAPSRYESFGLMNLEAMMFSRPVVSCRVGGINEVVVSGETGILVDPDDAEGLAQALRSLVDDPALRERMGTAGRRRFEAEFSNEIAVQRTVDLFARTVQRAPTQKRQQPGGRSRRCAWAGERDDGAWRDRGPDGSRRRAVGPDGLPLRLPGRDRAAQGCFASGLRRGALSGDPPARARSGGDRVKGAGPDQRCDLAQRRDPRDRGQPGGALVERGQPFSRALGPRGSDRDDPAHPQRVPVRRRHVRDRSRRGVRAAARTSRAGNRRAARVGSKRVGPARGAERDPRAQGDQGSPAGRSGPARRGVLHHRRAPPAARVVGCERRLAVRRGHLPAPAGPCC